MASGDFEKSMALPVIGLCAFLSKGGQINIKKKLLGLAK